MTPFLVKNKRGRTEKKIRYFYILVILSVIVIVFMSGCVQNEERAGRIKPTETLIETTKETPIVTATIKPAIKPTTHPTSKSHKELEVPVYPSSERFPILEEIKSRLSIPANLTCDGYFTKASAENVTEWYHQHLRDWSLENEIVFSPPEKPKTTIYLQHYRKNEEGAFIFAISVPEMYGTLFGIVTGDWMTIKEIGNLGSQKRDDFPELGSGTVTFKVFPVEYAVIKEIWPLGHLNPPAHTFPTDHGYILFKNPSKLHVVRAPADGIIYRIWEHKPNDFYICIAHTNTFRSCFDHLGEINGSILEKARGKEWVKIPIKTGEIIGRGPSKSSVSIDWGVFNYEVTLNFIHPKYYRNSAHAVYFLDYCSEEIKNEVSKYLTRKVEPRSGKIDYDQPGRLVGNWFFEGNISIENWETHLSFVYDMNDPTQIRIGIGGILNITPAAYAVVGNSPDPAKVTVANGTVVYWLVGAPEFGYTHLKGTLLVEVLDGERIKVEAFKGHIPNPQFTSNAVYYVR